MARQSGLMIIRIWVEKDSAEPLRVHIRLTEDLARGFERDETLTDVDVVCEVVRELVERVSADS